MDPSTSNISLNPSLETPTKRLAPGPLLAAIGCANVVISVCANVVTPRQQTIVRDRAGSVASAHPSRMGFDGSRRQTTPVGGAPRSGRLPVRSHGRVVVK